MFNGDTGYLQHDLKLTSLNTFALDMVEHDNSPKPTAFTAKWSQSNGQILLNGTMANPAPDTWTYIRLAVDTPSGVTHETKAKIGYNANGVFSDNLWIISEPGEYVFRVSNWDGGPVMEARATVPSEGLISLHQLLRRIVMVLGHLLPTMLVRRIVMFITFIVLVTLLVFLMTTVVTAVISIILLSVTVVAIPSLIVNVMVPGTSWSATKATIMEIFGLQRSSPIQLNT